VAMQTFSLSAKGNVDYGAELDEELVVVGPSSALSNISKSSSNTLDDLGALALELRGVAFV
jgi:hypothetical protein